MKDLKGLKLTLLIGQYAQQYYLQKDFKKNLTETVRSYRDYLDQNIIPLPHPSPRNEFWLRRNLWFVEELLPVLRERVKAEL